MSETAKKPSFILSVGVLVVIAAIISYGILGLGQDAHMPIVMATAFAAIVGRFVLGIRWGKLEEGAMSAIASGLQAVLILFTVGILIGVWVTGGIVPGMIYYGLDILSPAIFLLATLIICSIVSIATGTSWGTSGSVGIALLGIGAGLGVPAPITAGVIISGAYAGDKMSPLSDTTNLAPAVSGSTLFDHIRAMCWTTGPTYLIVMAITIFLGMGYAKGTLDLVRIEAIQQIMAKEFDINPICFLPPLIVIVSAVFKMPAIPGLVLGILSGAAIMVFHGTDMPGMIGAMHYGYEAALSGELGGAEGEALAKLISENGLGAFSPELVKEIGAMLSDLLTRGGLDSMMWSNSLVILALVLGGIMERCGYLEVILGAILKGVSTAGGLILTVIVSCFFSNVFLADQYLSLVIPGRMFKKTFEKSGLAPRMLSRSLEDCGTLSSPLVPWNTCGAYQSGTLGVPTIEYLPYAFLNYINPILAVVITYLGIGIYWRKPDGNDVVERKTAINPIS